MEEVKETKRGKVKEHFKKHKAKYITGAVVVGVGVAGGFILSQRMSIVNIDILPKVSDNAIYKPTYQINVPNRRGHAGDIIRCVETGEVFASQRRAAEMLNISRTDLNKHLNGKKDNVQGLHFEKIGDFNSQE